MKRKCPRCEQMGDAYQGNYTEARAQCLARTNQECALCERPAVQSHHRAMNYPCGKCITESDLIPLCLLCHEVATTIRRFHGNIWNFMATFREAIDTCYSTSKLRGFAPSSCTPGQGLTPATLPISKRQNSLAKKEATELKLTTPESQNSNASLHSGWTGQTIPQSQRQRYAPTSKPGQGS